MKLRFLMLILLLAVVGRPAGPQQAYGPLAKNQIMELVKAGMETAELVKLIREHGVDFDLTDDYLQSLRDAGAQEPVLQVLRAAKPSPLTKEQVLELVAGHVASQRAAALVRRHGIDFPADEQYFETLRLAGADDELIAALRQASAAATAEVVLTTSANAEVYFDGELQGRVDSLGKMLIRSKRGDHTVKITLAGKKELQRSVTLAAGKVTNIEAKLEDKVGVNPKDGLKYVWIPPGTFMMGCSPGDNECDGDEMPSHLVTISSGFWLGQTPVTVGAYKRFAGSLGRKMPSAPNYNKRWANDNMPIVKVSWYDAHDYCDWADGRLPTEAEWEYAARGGSTEARYGNLERIAWYRDNSGKQTHAVAQKLANGFGLFDAVGNVWEWVSDWYDENFYRNSRSEDPAGLASGEWRVLRGGSWYNDSRYVRVSSRTGYQPSGRDDGRGFRCVGAVVNP